MTRPYSRVVGRGRPARTGQALVELGLTLGLFVVVVLLIFDTSWLLYHQLVATQACKRTSRFAGTNRFNQAQITDCFFQSTPMTRITSTNSDVTLTVTTQAADIAFADAQAPGGFPSVTVRVTYTHRIIAPFPGNMSQFTITGTAKSMISTWTEVPVVRVPNFTDVCPCP